MSFEIVSFLIMVETASILVSELWFIRVLNYLDHAMSDGRKFHVRWIGKNVECRGDLFK
jgi:hypothetical protein